MLETPRVRRERERSKYRPKAIDLLLVAEAPPCSEDRYFYFDDVREHDWLFRYVVKGLRTKGFPVIDERMHFPTSGQQQRFEFGFARALNAAGWRPPE